VTASTGGVDRSGLAVGRREALTASTLGIGSLLLPAAGAAASLGTLAFEPSAFAYSTETTIAAWLPFDSDDPAAYAVQADEIGPGVVAKRVDRDLLKAYLTIAGTPGEDGDPQVTGRDGGLATSPNEPIDLTPSYSEWRMRNSSSSITLGTTPHLRFTISALTGRNGAGTLTLATLVLHSVSNISSAPNNAVNLAVFVTAPGANGAETVLRRTASIPDGATDRHIVINLGLSGRSFTGGDSVTVRIYPYATESARDVRFRRFNSDPAPQALTAADAVDDRVNAILDSSSDWMAAFIGTFDPPPDV
jgi:hypothetical protein